MTLNVPGIHGVQFPVEPPRQGYATQTTPGTGEAELRREIIGAVLDGSDRLLTEARLGRLKGAMTEEEVRRFANSLNWALER